MKWSALALAAAFVLVTPLGAAVHLPVFVESFEVSRDTWEDYGHSVVEREASGSGTHAYAPGVASATGLHHARLDTGDCDRRCVGPFTRWGEYGTTFPADGFTTEIKIYLDMAYAEAHPDERFDWTSAASRPDGTHLRDFVFNAGTSPHGEAAWVVSASHNAIGWPSNPNRDPVTVTESGWYTFRQTFVNVDDVLVVNLDLVDPSGETAGSWALGGSDPIENVGGNRYGWFAVVDTSGLVFDDAIRLSCAPVGPLGVGGC